MSIFKESFRQFVQQQMKIREAIISKGNNGDSRFSGGTVDLSKVGGKANQTIDPSAFFTNTVQRQCVIRMSSGCDLTEFGSKEFAEGGKYEKPKHIKGSGLARRYILQGGTLAVDRETLEQSDVSTTDKITATIDGKVDKEFTETTRTRKEKYKYKLGNRSGFRGISPNDFGTAYGDPTIRANPGEDYGSVPMPGIKTANIRTKSAYGSLREAKVDFVCHNLRQLETLELLYMRPGIPILLEWGWTPYINNKGKRTLDFPFIGEWWIAEGSMDSINRKIIEEKIKSGGNYDALAGMCKNFSYKARPDGGFDCTTEIIAMGEIIETLKGESFIVPTNMASGNLITNSVAQGAFSISDAEAKAADFLELGLNDFHNFSLATDRTTSNEGGKRNNLSMKIYQKIGFDSTWNYWDSIPIVNFITGASDNKINALKTLSTGRLFAPSPVANLSYYFALDTLSKEELIKMGYGTESNSVDELILNGLKTFILTEDSYFPLDDDNGFYINTPYIRWDAFCTFLNLYVINKDATGTPIVTFSTTSVVDEDTKPRVEPLLMSRINVGKGIPLPDGGYYNSRNVRIKPSGLFNNFNATFSVNSVLNASVDPSICLFPEQLSFSTEGNFSPILYLGAMAIGFGVGAVASGGVGAGVGAVAGGEFYTKLAGETVMTSNNKNSRNIGNIYINLFRLQRIYKDQRYDGEGELNDNFNLHDFIKKVWDDISAASGNKHKFIIHNDLERPSVLRIIDANFQKDDELTPDKIHELKIQSNDTICRDFSYNSIIPNEMSATIGVAMQNPDSIQDIDGATFAAMARGIKSRFHVPVKTEIEEPTEDEKKQAAEGYNKTSIDTTQLFTYLASFQGRLMRGDLQKIDEETGEADSQEEISKAQSSLKNFFNRINKLLTLHSKDGKYSNGTKYYKGYPKKVQNAPPVSSVIPLKFNAKLDGISGVTIGNVFKIEPSRLPKGYRGSDIAFVCMGEQQAITAGQDWTTDIHGQLVLLPAKLAEPVDNKSNNGSDKGYGNGDGAGEGTGEGTGEGVGDISAENALEGESTDIGAEEIVPSTETNETTSNTPISTEEQMNQQDQCPPGQYFDEFLQLCVIDQDISTSESVAAETEKNKAKAEKNYKQWLDNLINYIRNSKSSKQYTQEIFENHARVFLKPSNNAVDLGYAFFKNASDYARNVKTLSKGVEREMIEIFKERVKENEGIYQQGDKSISLEGGTSGFISRASLVQAAERIHDMPNKEGQYNDDMISAWKSMNKNCSDSLEDAKIPYSERELDSYNRWTYESAPGVPYPFTTSHQNHVAYYEWYNWCPEKYR